MPCLPSAAFTFTMAATAFRVSQLEVDLLFERINPVDLHRYGIAQFDEALGPATEEGAALCIKDEKVISDG
jgi:hypothetical protein